MALQCLTKDGFYGWINMAVMFFFNIAIMLMMLSFALFLPFWIDEFGWSRGWASGAQTLCVILTGIAGPAVGIFIMKKGAREAIVIGNLLSIVGLILLAYQRYLWQLYLGYGILVGLGMSIGGMLAMMTVINNWFVMKRPIALAIAMASMGFAGIVVSPSLMALIQSVGWRHAYFVIAGIVLIFSVVLPALFLKNKPEDLGQIPDGTSAPKAGGTQFQQGSYKNLYKTPVDFTAREAMRTPAMWLLIGFGTIQFLVMGGLTTHQIAFLFDLGISPAMAAVAAGILGAVMGASSLGIGFLGLKFRMQSLAIASVMIGIAGYTILLFAHSWNIVLAYNVMLGIGFGIQSIAMGNLLPDYFGRSEFPKIMGYSMPFTTVLASFGAPIAGYIRDATGSYIFWFQLSLALMAVALFFIVFAKPPMHPSLRRRGA